MDRSNHRANLVRSPVSWKKQRLHSSWLERISQWVRTKRATAQGSAVSGGRWRPGHVDGLQTAQPRGASKARGTPAGRPGPCEGRAARGQARSPGTRPRQDARHALPASPARSPVCGSCQLSLLPLTVSRLSLRPHLARPRSQHSLEPIPPSRGSPTSPSPSSREAGEWGVAQKAGVTLCWEPVCVPGPLRALSAGSCGRRGRVAFLSCASDRAVSQVTFSLISHNRQVALQLHPAGDVLYSLHFHPF